MKVYDDSMLQSLMDSAILGLGLFMGAAVLYGFAHFAFEYIRERRNKKDESSTGSEYALENFGRDHEAK